MKNCWIDREKIPNNQKRIVTTMKVFFLFSFVLIMSTHAHSFSQETVSLHLKNTSIKEIFSEIEKQSDYIFILSDNAENEINRQIDVDAVGQSVSRVLKQITDNTELKYDIFNKQIVVYTGDKPNVIKHTQRTPTEFKGRVTDAKGEPLIGVTIKIKNTTQGTTTDKDGNFNVTFRTDKDEVSFIFSYIGFESQEKILKKGENITIVMIEDVAEIGEVVVMGYQSLDRRDIVGSIATLKASDIKIPAFTSIDQMLQGQVPGLMVINTSSRVGTSPKIQIRGTTTLLGNQDPLWVVDGIIQPDPLHIDANQAMTEDLQTIIGNQISWLNPSDIENITVLKDASATAIYGSKASNGVIVITTKKGISDKVNISYHSSMSYRRRPTYNDFNLMNSRERIAYAHNAYLAGARYQEPPFEQLHTYEGLMRLFINRKIGMDDFYEKISKLEKTNTDWFKLLTRDSFSHQQYLSLSGKSSKTSYNVSLGYSKSKGIEIKNDSKRFTGRIRLGIELTPTINFDIILSGQQSNNVGFGPGVSPISYATSTSRAIPAYKDDGNYLFYKKKSYYELVAPNPLLGYNILNEIKHSDAVSKNSTWNTNLNFTWRIIPSLKYNCSIGIGYMHTNSYSYAGERTFYVANKYRGYDFGSVSPISNEYKAALLPFGGEYFTSNMHSSNINVQNMITYYKLFNQKHKINVLLGSEIRSNNNKSNSNTVWGYVPERGENLMSPATPQDIKPIGKSYNPFRTLGLFEQLYQGAWRSHSQENNFLSFFATAAYSYDNRYVLNFNIRSDASNRFGQNINRRFDPTYSAGASWRIAEESFFMDHIKFIEQFNVRVSYGIQGNALTNISPELIASMGRVLPVYNQYSSKIVSLPNPNLKWERTQTVNAGIDLSVFKKIQMVFEYYKRKSNAIFIQPIPQEYGKSNMYLNGGRIQNYGLEYTINFNAIYTKNFSWSFGINASKNWNKIQSNPTTQLFRSSFLRGARNLILKEGYPSSSFWSYSFKDLNPDNGYPEFNIPEVDYETAKKDPSSYLVYSGQTHPDFTGGLNTRIRYKDLSLGMNFSLIAGAKKRLPALFPNLQFIEKPEQNVNRDLKYRWLKPGDENKTKIPSFFSGGYSYYKLPDRQLENIYRMWDLSDYRLVNASFLRCNQITLTYDMSKLFKNKLRTVQISSNITNPFVIASKKFKGFDPELGNSVMPRIFSFSLNIGL